MKCKFGLLYCLLIVAASFAAEGQRVSYKSGDDTVHGMLYTPSGIGPFPALIAIHGAGGLNDDGKQRASRLADEGYLTLAVDLFRGQLPSDLAHARDIARGIPPGRLERDLRAAFAYLRQQANVQKDRVGAIGWCAGGSNALRLAAWEPDLHIAVLNWPTRLIDDPETLRKINASVLGIFGAKDTYTTPEGVLKFQQQMRGLGKKIEVVVYPEAGHAFDSPNSSFGYHPEDGADAWRRTVTYLARNLKTAAQSAATLAALAANQAVFDSTLRRDLTGLTDAFEDKLLWINPDGSRQTKSERVSALHAGKIWPDVLRADDEHAQCFGESCVVTGRYSYQRGGMAAENRFLRIIVRRDNQWKLLLHHATHIGEPAASFWAPPVERQAMRQAEFADAEGKFLQEMGPLIAKALIDADAREQIHARDYRFQNWRGAVSTREQMISQLRTGIQHVGQRTLDEEQVRLASDLAVYSARISQPGGRIAGEPRPELVRVTGIYVKHDGRWQDIVGQVSPVLTASAPPDFTLSP